MSHVDREKPEKITFGGLRVIPGETIIRQTGSKHPAGTHGSPADSGGYTLFGDQTLAPKRAVSRLRPKKNT